MVFGHKNALLHHYSILYDKTMTSSNENRALQMELLHLNVIYIDAHNILKIFHQIEFYSHVMFHHLFYLQQIINSILKFRK